MLETGFAFVFLGATLVISSCHIVNVQRILSQLSGHTDENGTQCKEIQWLLGRIHERGPRFMFAVSGKKLSVNSIALESS